MQVYFFYFLSYSHKNQSLWVKGLAIGERFWENTGQNLNLPICTTPHVIVPKVVKLFSCPRAYKWKCGQGDQSQMKSDDSSRDTQLRCTNVKPWMFSGNFALSKRVTLRKITKFSQFWLTHLFHHPVAWGHTCRHIFSQVRYNKSNLKAITWFSIFQENTSHLFLLQFHAFNKT